jgi:hypothetical protein
MPPSKNSPFGVDLKPLPPLCAALSCSLTLESKYQRSLGGVEDDIPSELVNKRESIDLERLFAGLQQITIRGSNKCAYRLDSCFTQVEFSRFHRVSLP